MDHRLIGYSLLTGKGLEIGALHQPAALPASCVVEYCDALRPEDIVAHFPELADTPLTPVDHVIDLDREGLAPFAEASQDFVVINHVIEHVANPIRVVADALRILRPHGLLVISAPDKEFTFDRARECTSFEHLRAEYEAGVDQVSDEHYAEFLRAVHPEVAPEGGTVWASAMLSVRQRREHAHVWTSETFRAFLEQAVAYLKLSAAPIFELRGSDSNGEYFGVWRKYAADGVDTLLEQRDAMARQAMEKLLQWRDARYQGCVARAETLERMAREQHDAQVHIRNLEAIIAQQQDEARAALKQFQDEQQTLQAEREGLRRQLADREATVQALIHSSSWRVTAPLRAITRTLNRLAKPS